MRSLLSVIGIFVVLLCSCRRDPVRQTLDVAEFLMDDRPDSALALLTDVDGSTLNGETQARYALLLSQAYDKNYIDIANDSLIKIFLSYFASHNDLGYRMLSEYYSAISKLNQGDYDKALPYALSARRDAEILCDSTYITRSEFLISKLYLNSYNEEGAALYLTNALKHSKEINRNDWVGLAHYNLASLFLSKKEYQSAAQSLDSASLYLPIDSDFVELKLLVLFGNQDYEAYDSVYQSYPSVFYRKGSKVQLETYDLYAKSMLMQKPVNKALLNTLLAQASHQDSIDIAYIGRHICLADGNFEDALKYTDILLRATDNTLTDLAAHSLYQIQIRDEISNAENLSMEIQQRKQLIIFLTILCLLVLVISLLIIICLRKTHSAQLLKRKNEIVVLSSEYKRLKQEMSDQETMIEQLSEDTSTQITELQCRISAGERKCRELFLLRYNWVEEFGHIIIDSGISKSEDKLLLKKIKGQLDTVKSKKFLKEIADAINTYRQDIITRIDKMEPSISDHERSILILMCAGLSARIIGLILNISPQAIYNAKSSIKKKLTVLNPEILHELDDLFS